MKNKRGFTLIELLCVIAIIALITVMASAAIVNITHKSKENMYCAKVKLIETKAVEYGIRYELELNNSNEIYEGYKSMKIKIKELVDNGALDESDIIDPLNNNSMSDLDIILYLKNNQINAKILNNVCEK